MGKDIVDPTDNQPFSSGDKAKHREYEAAIWKPRGMGGGAPKVSGGFSIDKRDGTPCGNGLNRPNSTYSLPQSTIQARRAATATAQYAAAVICIGTENIYEVRSPSGNNYDVNVAVNRCDCPDYWRQEQSGYGILKCWHMYAVQMALVDPALPHGIPWGTDKLAEECGVDRRAAEAWCHEGLIPATKKHNVWLIDPDDGAAFRDNYLTRIVGKIGI